jgi:glutamine synthetase
LTSEIEASVLQKCKKNDVRLIILEFVDILGTPKSVTIPMEHLEEALANGIGFDGSSVEGFVRIHESDMIAMPDPSTFRIIPWRPTERREARIICDIYRPGGQPFEGDPRNILKKVLKEAEELGFIYNTGPELEFFLFKTEDGYKIKKEPHDTGGYFDYSPLDMASDIRREATFNLQEMGLDVEMCHHEVAPGQHEIDFKFSDALISADNVITYKNTLKATALNHGLYATFMPKPIFGENGSGMHVHQSLFKETGGNAFFDLDDKYKLSDVAPVYICWGRRNRSALIRVPEYFPGMERATRAELRCPDPSCNPYLAFAVMLKAGLNGIKNEVQPPNPVEEDVYDFDDKTLAEFYIQTLPSSLEEAIREFETNALMKETLGEYTFNVYLNAKKKEWDEYRLNVSQWELNRYLRM